MDTLDLVALVESNNNPQAYRIEPRPLRELFDFIEGKAQPPTTWTACCRAQKIHSCSDHSAAAIVSASWGAYQIMGFNLWADWCLPAVVISDASLRFSDYLNEERWQRATADAFLNRLNINYSIDDLRGDSAKLHRFVMSWNGPGNIDAYIARMRECGL